MAEKRDGGLMTLYVTDTDPTSDQFNTTNYTKVGFRKTTDLNESADAIDYTDADSAAMEYEPSIPDAVISGTFNKDFAGDAGAEICRTALRGETKIWWFYTTEITDDKVHAGRGVVTEFSETNPHQGPAEVTLTIQVDGAISSAPVS